MAGRVLRDKEFGLISPSAIQMNTLRTQREIICCRIVTLSKIKLQPRYIDFIINLGEFFVISEYFYKYYYVILFSNNGHKLAQEMHTVILRKI
jgi:hypothetical protein